MRRTTMATAGSWEDDEDEDDLELAPPPPREREHDPRDRLRSLIQTTIAIVERREAELYIPE